ncbi:Transcriptional regulator [Nitrospira sp. KM1]|uniref:helix-turn-helix transcriptional regulator n=1 Tax=Nitrospira sp. KM1 TaxID=1936990 RepID=UPI0013A766CA|nr:LuxR family transcriptional regulator [Nitrospira sp. KM1]BCA55734.1 Transcriptional regulator [Nitrospira sp. KM1]
MSEPLGQEYLVSDSALSGEFPFIQRGGNWTSHPNAHSIARHRPWSNSIGPIEERRPFPADLFSGLSKRETQNIAEVLHHALDASTGDDVYHLLQLIQQAVDCPRVIGGVAQLTAKGHFKEFNSVLNVSYSNDWLYSYGKNGYAAVDPVLQSFLTSCETQVWTQTYSGKSSARQMEFIEEARSYGLTHGLTTGMRERTGRYATFFSFAGGDAASTIRYKSLLEYLIPYLHRIMIANINTPVSNRVKGLSPREMTVLMWMKQGKTNWEISRIIGVSERTVRFHVESIFMKLDVNSRTQAVAFAIENGLLADE